ncbi:MAG: aminomethyl-transferring glycine dehydrogenase [Chthoniobacteraceae bacterium]|jgi:glycine dehydrogenase
MQTSGPLDSFPRRHIGPGDEESAAMLLEIGFATMDEMIERAVPASIRLRKQLNLPPAKGERESLAEMREIAEENRVARNFIGAGYYGCVTPPVIQRNILENPGWYTAYTPYQAEIAQGRLEALLNFQTMITDLTALDIANASLLDEATAAAEAMAICLAARKEEKKSGFFVSQSCHAQTIAVIRTRAKPLGIAVTVGDEREVDFAGGFFGGLFQYPATDGEVRRYDAEIGRLHAAGGLAVVAADLLALTLLRPPGEFGADIAVGSSQRFGVPLGFGGPHAAYFATRDGLKRHMPGRLVGVSHDAEGRPGYRLALQTREQHIRREKATSNICTAQVLLAVMASMYAVYHGPRGLRKIARRIHSQAQRLAAALTRLGHGVAEQPIFDTVRVTVPSSAGFLEAALKEGVNLRALDDRTVCISLDETTDDLGPILRAFNAPAGYDYYDPYDLYDPYPAELARTGEFLTHPVFNSYHTETEMLRYIRRLEAKDLSLTTSMIPLGSCTMKLNATSEMLPVTWPEIGGLHPFAPAEQTRGYARIFSDLEKWLAEITGFAAISLQPNAGSQGEYAGLMAIRDYNADRDEGHRKVCLIPQSAHGTNPASAAMAGFRVVTVGCLEDGDIDLDDLRAKAAAHAVDLACLMVTYPSTHGVFEEGIQEVCEIIHAHGGQVYMDGANMNAQAGLCRPAEMGADVCHLNLHKTFCIPHGGGGPGVGPIGVAAHLAPFLPGPQGKGGQVSAAPYGSASILVISWMYIRMMGADGLRRATETAILNANYIAHRLEPYFPVLFRGKGGLVAHECILDLRRWKGAGIEVEDVAKRLMDYGFHAPTVSWPVPGTVMIEPTESESRAELDRFCDAMISIHAEMKAVETGAMDRANNPLKRAPHTAAAVTADAWDRPYSRQTAAFPAPWLRTHKFWPAVARIDNVYGDRNLQCSCPPVEVYAEPE